MALESIEAQTISKDIFEMVIVADRISVEDIKRILAKFTFACQVFESNKPGIVSALNLGLSVSKGEYIARMDEDDVMEVKRLELQYRFLKKNTKYVALGGQLKLIDQHGIVLGPAGFQEKISDSVQDLLIKSPIAHPAVMFNRQIATEIGGYRDFLPEDWDLWLRLSEVGQIGNLPQNVLYYRVHDQQLSRQKFYELRKARFAMAITYALRKMQLSDQPPYDVEPFAWFKEMERVLKTESQAFRKIMKITGKYEKYEDLITMYGSSKKLRFLITLIFTHPLKLFKKLFGRGA